VIERIVEVFVGDCALGVAPLVDEGLGTPPAQAHTEPQIGVTGAERTQLLGGAGQGGDFRRSEEGEDADLNVLREIGEGRGNGVVLVIGHFVGNKCN